jgi:murein DD-endopeptidase MepM/ murein hydrolase activator NlpD
VVGERDLYRETENLLRKRFYIMFVARDADGQLLKIPIPVHYLYVFVAGALIGILTVTGMAGSYTRMLAKTLNYNELRSETEAIKKNYQELEKVAETKERQVAALSSLAGEVSALYGLKTEPTLMNAAYTEQSLNQFYALKTSAMSGVTSIALGFGPKRAATLNDWMRLAAQPSLWPVEGRIVSSFGERIDPFNGEGAFHRGVDISGDPGQNIYAPADGVIEFTGTRSGYGKTVIVAHDNDISTLFGHMSGYAVTAGQRVSRGDVIGYVGSTGRSTGPHVHYEVHIRNAPVNPYKYLRTTLARQPDLSARGD